MSKSKRIELQHVKVEKHIEGGELKRIIPMPQNMEELEVLRTMLEEIYGKNSAFYFTYRTIENEPDEKPKTDAPA